MTTVRARSAGSALLVACTTLATGCGGSAGDAGDRAKAELSQGVMGVHLRALSERAADPTARDEAAAARLGDAITGGNATNVVSTTVTPEGVEVVTTVGVSVEVGGGHFYEQAALGACLRTRATPGSLTGDVGQRGTVFTEAVPCPRGVIPVVESRPVDVTTADLQTLHTSVPRPAPPPCFSGSGDCVGG